MDALCDAELTVSHLMRVNNTATALESMILIPLIADAQALVHNISAFISARDES
jgi:hypothetical protein